MEASFPVEDPRSHDLPSLVKISKASRGNVGNVTSKMKKEEENVRAIQVEVKEQSFAFKPDA